jgi:hypothetical protein
MIATPAQIPSCPSGFARHRGESAHPELWDGLVGLWAPHLGPTGDTVFNWSPYGQAYNVTLTNMDAATDWVSTRYGWALDFDGNSDYLNVPYRPGLSGGTDNFSLAFWLNYRSQHISTLFDTRAGGSALTGVMIFTGTFPTVDHTINFDFNDSSQHQYRNSYGPSLNDGLFHHLLFTFDRGAALWTYYLDGKQVATQDISATTGDVDGGQPYRIMGARYPGGANGNGVVFAWMHWQRVLTPPEASQLYRDPFALLRPRRRALSMLPAIGSPYHVAAGEALCTGAATRQLFHTGTVEGELFSAGSIIGVCDGRSD